MQVQFLSKKNFTLFKKINCRSEIQETIWAFIIS